MCLKQREDIIYPWTDTTHGCVSFGHRNGFNMWLSVSSAIRDVVERAVHQNALSFLNVSGVALGSGGPTRDFLSHCAEASSIQGTKLPLLDLCGHDEDSWSESLKGWLRLPPLPVISALSARRRLSGWTGLCVALRQLTVTMETSGCKPMALEEAGQCQEWEEGSSHPTQWNRKNPFMRGGGKPYENNCSSEEKEVRI